VDVNVKRVISRINNKQNLNNIEIKKLAKKILSLERSGDFNEAIMDLGSKICKAKDPKCTICPLNKICRVFKYNKKALLNINSKNIFKKKIIKYGNCYVIGREKDNKFFFVRRPNKGLLGGMLSFPSSLWVEDKNNIPNDNIFKNFILHTNIKNCVHHTFSHFKLILNIYEINIDEEITIEGEWIKREDAIYQLPSLMKKVASII
jgi:A/G-specific adenine glycosylase